MNLIPPTFKFISFHSDCRSRRTTNGSKHRNSAAHGVLSLVPFVGRSHAVDERPYNLPGGVPREVSRIWACVG